MLSRATHDGRAEAAGFDRNAESIDIAKRLESWQKASDERLWKLIVFPEFGDRTDLKQLTRDLLLRMERDLGMPLQWVAVAHYNTEHPHIHVALRGIGSEGRSVHLRRDYIRQGIRCAAEDLCTRQLGYRTEFDAAAARRREVHEHHYTSLDRRASCSSLAKPGADRDVVGPAAADGILDRLVPTDLYG